MNDFIEKLRADLNEIGRQIRLIFAKIGSKFTGKPVEVSESGSIISSKVSTTYEISLVPEVKARMIKAQKMRNLVLFICIVVSSVAVGAVLILFGIKSGQDIAMSNQDKKLETMSQKLNGYGELEDLVTFQAQLDGLSAIVGQKTVMSRIFGALGAMLPTGGDSVQLSDLRINMATNTVNMEGQANAQVSPLIDYRVLESFKKGVALTKYDYGNFVDAMGNTLPTYCVREADADGNSFRTGDSYYAWWDLTIEGCEAVPLGTLSETDAKFYYRASDEDVEMGTEEYEGEKIEQCDENGENCQLVPKPERVCDENGENCEERPVELKEVPLRVKIWRTPQFAKWYEAKYMGLDGAIENVEHFESVCYKYSGNDTLGTVRWTSVNDCMLAPDGLAVSSSSNGRDDSNNLVLRFTASTVLAEDFFMYRNKHMIAIGPMGQNVTDSYVQIGNMFAQEARECSEDDSECLSNSRNEGEGEGEA